MEKKKVWVLVCVIGILLLAIGISFAFWKVLLQQESVNVVNSSCLKLELQDQNEISLENAVPILDEDGMLLTPYEFTLTNVCNSNATFDITLEILNETTFEDFDFLKVMMDEKDPELITTKPEIEPSLLEAKTSYFLKKGYLGANESKSYKLRLWMDEDTPAEERYMNKAFQSKIVVVATTYEKEIDTEAPIADFTTTKVDGGYLIDARTSTDAGSGITTYYYSKDGINWISSKEDNYVFKDDNMISYGIASEVITSRMNANVYDIYVKVEDNFENMSSVVKKNVRARELVLDETIDNNLRYVGANPNNYVTFNNEVWRVIGVMNHVINQNGNLESRLKIVKNENIGNYAYGTYWPASNLKDYLNTSYISNIALESQNMIGQAIWDLGSAPFNTQGYGLPKQFYEKERGDEFPSASEGKWLGNISLIYLSDYGFAVGGEESTRVSCLNKTIGTWDGNVICRNNAWLFLADALTLTSTGIYPYTIAQKGYPWTVYWSNAFRVYPSLYLKSDVRITAGDGSLENPFQLAI